ncbi:hypothetical protein ACSBR2_009756 [Camellia fascicularis]
MAKTIKQYLFEVEHFAKNQTFEILDYWKVNVTKYRVLSQLARDVLAIPIFTVASESAFSTGERILDPFCSSLSLSMVKALAMDDGKEFEQYDSGFINQMHRIRIEFVKVGLDVIHDEN